MRILPDRATLAHALRTEVREQDIYWSVSALKPSSLNAPLSPSPAFALITIAQLHLVAELGQTTGDKWGSPKAPFPPCMPRIRIKQRGNSINNS